MNNTFDYIPLLIDDTEYEGYFMSDYIRLKNINRYELSKLEKKEEVFILQILGRKRLKTLVVEKDNFIELKTISNSKGVFKIYVEGKEKEVIFKNQYCQHFTDEYEQKIQHDIYNDKIKHYKINRVDNKPVYLIALN
jgi:hypothetical protein